MLGISTRTSRLDHFPVSCFIFRSHTRQHIVIIHSAVNRRIVGAIFSVALSNEISLRSGN